MAALVQVLFIRRKEGDTTLARSTARDESKKPTGREDGRSQEDLFLSNE
jgi:hypothetical protein